MNLVRSLQEFLKICRGDAAFRALGRPAGWSVLFHYQGRWHDRRGSNMPLQMIRFCVQGRPVLLEANARCFGPFQGVFIEREYDCTANFHHRPARILDLGGNIGFGSVFLAGIFPGAKFAIVEPDPRNLPILRRNLAANQIDATVLEGAIGSHPGILNLRFGADPACSSLEGTGMHMHSDAIGVAVTTVPAIMAQMGWDRIDLLKIDIEGAEEDLLTRENEWLARVDALIVEVHPNTTPERLNTHLARFELKLERFGSGHEPVYFAQRRTAIMGTSALVVPLAPGQSRAP